MQKSIFLAVGLLITGVLAVTASANLTEPLQMAFALKVDTIAKMYEQDSRNQGQEYPSTLQQYADSELQVAMQLEQEYFDKEQVSCHIGYDVLWRSQDPDYTQDKTFSLTTTGMVQVNLAQVDDVSNQVYYELACDESVCQIADVILDSDGTSLREYLIKSCRSLN
ncbi:MULTISPECIES: hypothetical protein [unclassified Psychrobacter]|uniref:hypothetical protein n=1 Tax=unclassified Psychrobacter TaxID=196806 RepID=UPI003FD2B163